jgi:hypothetical protein
LADVEHEVAASRSALAKLKANLGNLKDALLDAQNHVTAAMDRGLRAPAEQALSEAEGLALRLRELMPTLWFFLRPEMDPAMVGRPMPPLFSIDWNDEVRRLGRERADRRSYASGRACGERNAPFKERGAAIQRFVEQPPHSDGEWYRHPALQTHLAPLRRGFFLQWDRLRQEAGAVVVDDSSPSVVALNLWKHPEVLSAQ